MMLHIDRDRWIVRCDGVLGDKQRCPVTAEGRTRDVAVWEAKARGMILLAGGRWACPAEHKMGVS